MKVKITSLDHNGRGITKLDNKICFVEGALIDELVDIELVNQKKNYIEAKTKKIIISSNKRITSPCKYASICGGCNIMHMSYDSQLEYKVNKVKEVFKKFSGIDVHIDEILPSNNFNYRNKITLHVDKKMGLYQDKSKEIIEIDECLISDYKINNLIKLLNLCDLTGIKSIVIKSTTEENMVVLDIKKEIDEKYFIDLLKDKVTSLILKYNSNYRTLYGKNYIVEKLGKFKFIISPDSFFQVNTSQALKLYNKVKEFLGNENNNVLDLYCGTGTIGIFVSDNCKRVTGIEINKYAVNDANENKNINNIKNIEFFCGDSGSILKTINKEFDSVIVDPPRTGLDKIMISQLIRINPQKIIYVSCDPVTLARDIKELSNKYSIKQISLVDMFPNTSHVECVSVLHRKVLEK